MPGRGDEALLRADVPGIHVLHRREVERVVSYIDVAKTWMAGTSPAMTENGSEPTQANPALKRDLHIAPPRARAISSSNGTRARSKSSSRRTFAAWRPGMLS